MGAIVNFLADIIQGIYNIIKSHGWAIVIFTLIIRAVLMPLDISSRKGMRKMAKIQPQLTALQKKYANDKAKLQQKQSELMRKERYNPLSGCLPLLLQFPIMIAMFNAMRAIANEQIVLQVFDFLAGETVQFEGWLWVKNIWSADSFLASVAPTEAAIRAIPLDIWQAAFANGDLAGVLAKIPNVVEAFAGVVDKATLDTFINATIMPALTAPGSAYNSYMAVSASTNIPLLGTLSIFKEYNGYLILPVLSGLSQLLMTKVNPQATGQQPAAEGQPNMGNFMKYFFPLFSVYITLTSNAGFAIYWVTSNLIATAMSYFINIYFDKKDQQTAALELKEGSVK